MTDLQIKVISITTLLVGAIFLISSIAAFMEVWGTRRRCTAEAKGKVRTYIQWDTITTPYTLLYPVYEFFDLGGETCLVESRKGRSKAFGGQSDMELKVFFDPAAPEDYYYVPAEHPMEVPLLLLGFGVLLIFAAVYAFIGTTI